MLKNKHLAGKIKRLFCFEFTGYIGQNSPEKQNQYDVYICRKKFIIRNWLTRLWRLRNPESSVGKLEIQSKSEGLRMRNSS